MYGPASFQSHMCANFSYGGGGNGRFGQLAREGWLELRLYVYELERLKKTHLGRGELRTTSQSCL